MGRRARASVAALMVGTIGLTAPLGAAASGETPIPVVIGNEAPANFNFRISPTLLPAIDPGTTELKLAVEGSPPIGSGDGFPPRIQEAEIGIDRSIRLEPGDLPVCRRPGVNFPQVEATGADLCPPAAAVGHAEASIEVAFPESKPLILSTEGKVYIGGIHRGVPDLLVVLPAEIPVSGTIAFLVPIRPVRGGRIGSEITFTAPTLLGGNGFFLDFQLDLERGFTEHGERHGYVVAECPNGKLAATLTAVFTDGTRYSQESVRACSRRRHRP